MIDMRGEEEAILQPHSQVRHELMHNQYNKMKEEEDHWQDVSVLIINSHVFQSACIYLFFDKVDFFFLIYSSISCLHCVRRLSVISRDFYACKLKLKVESNNLISFGEPQQCSQSHSAAEPSCLASFHRELKNLQSVCVYQDLAKWKNRRRSVSQDLIKKEEERKMMEQLMSGDTCISGRRRSIKTYREIVEDKQVKYTQTGCLICIWLKKTKTKLVFTKQY